MPMYNNMALQEVIQQWERILQPIGYYKKTQSLNMLRKDVSLKAGT